MTNSKFTEDIRQVHKEMCNARKNAPAKSAIRGLRPTEPIRTTEKK